MAPEERAREGVFLAFQYPVEIPGVNNAYFLKAALNAIRKHRGQAELDAMEFLQLMREKAKLLEIDRACSRAVNEGFSGGEKKRNEIFQMAVLEPKLAILDETDSGLDIDALQDRRRRRQRAARAAERAMIVDHPLPAAARTTSCPTSSTCWSDGRIVQVGRQGAGAGAGREGLRLARAGAAAAAAGRERVGDSR